MMKAAWAEEEFARSRAESGGLALQHAESSRAPFGRIDEIERA
jgi:hypothetical protein